jgi:hypothetical protein
MCIEERGPSWSSKETHPLEHVNNTSRFIHSPSQHRNMHVATTEEGGGGKGEYQIVYRRRDHTCDQLFYPMQVST